jgi:F0F1-type ATP synthase assembly protein I
VKKRTLIIRIIIGMLSGVVIIERNTSSDMNQAAVTTKNRVAHFANFLLPTMCTF